MSPIWYILKHLLDRPNYTAHLDPECSHLKLRANPRRLRFVTRSHLGVHIPCKMCGGVYREQWEAEWARRMYERCRENLKGNPCRDRFTCAMKKTCTVIRK